MRPFVTADIGPINNWYNARGLPDRTPDMFPANGLVEPGVAAGFLFRTDAPGFCFLEEFVTNPEASIRNRTLALRAISEVLIDTAQRLGFARVYGFCSTRGMERLAAKCGLRQGNVVAVYGKEF